MDCSCSILAASLLVVHLQPRNVGTAFPSSAGWGGFRSVKQHWIWRPSLRPSPRHGASILGGGVQTPHGVTGGYGCRRSTHRPECLLSNPGRRHSGGRFSYWEILHVDSLRCPRLSSASTRLCLVTPPTMHFHSLLTGNTTKWQKQNFRLWGSIWTPIRTPPCKQFLFIPGEDFKD